MKFIIKDVRCPKCNAVEMHPNGKRLLIRAFKYADENGKWWSQCLVCSGGYDENLVFNQENHDPSKGWF
jgi:hypothetical protein